MWLTGPSGLHRNSPQGLNIIAIRVFDQIRDLEIPITLRPLEKDGACKMNRQNKKCSCARKSGRRKNNAGTDKEEEKKLAGHWLRRNCLLEDALEGMVNGKKV